MAKGDNNKRWFDSDDFTPAHDEIMVQVMTGWKIFIKNWLAMTNPKSERALIDGKFYGEPELKGYPPVYPDGIISYNAEYGHPMENTTLYKTPRKWDTFNNTWNFYRNAVAKGYKSAYKPEPPEDCEIKCKCMVCNGTVSMDGRYHCSSESGVLILEIKPKIDSFGSVLRQLNIYKDREEVAFRILDNPLSHRNHYFGMVLVTPDHRYDELFHNQNIWVADPQDFIPSSKPSSPDPRRNESSS